jgi:hypothetical protein
VRFFAIDILQQLGRAALMATLVLSSTSARAQQPPSSSTPAPTPQPSEPAPADPSAPGSSAQPGTNETKPTPAPTEMGNRMFGIMPNFATVYGSHVPSISTRQKFVFAVKNTFDPFVFPFVGIIAATGDHYGSGASGYMQQYAATLTDTTVSNFLTAAVLPSLLRQDPRFFQQGRGGTLHRAAYAASRVAFTRSDAGPAQFNVSEVAGNAMAAAIGNAYYPLPERTTSAMLERWGSQMFFDAVSYELKEFWPDIRGRLHHR